jgi:hypothetical protein
LPLELCLEAYFERNLVFWLVFCDGKAVVLPSTMEGVAAVSSCQVTEDFIKVWALI